MTPILSLAWPPIIDAASKPRRMLWRDRILTAVMWLLLVFLCRRGLAYFSTALIGFFARGQLNLTGWGEGWTRLRPYMQLVALFAGWELFWIIATLWRRQRALRKPQPPSLALAEEAEIHHCAPGQIVQWRQFRICVVHLDPAGHPTLVLRDGEAET